MYNNNNAVLGIVREDTGSVNLSKYLVRLHVDEKTGTALDIDAEAGMRLCVVILHTTITI